MDTSVKVFPTTQHVGFIVYNAETTTYTGTVGYQHLPKTQQIVAVLADGDILIPVTPVGGETNHVDNIPESVIQKLSAEIYDKAHPQEAFERQRDEKALAYTAAHQALQEYLATQTFGPGPDGEESAIFLRHEGLKIYQAFTKASTAYLRLLRSDSPEDMVKVSEIGYENTRVYDFLMNCSKDLVKRDRAAVMILVQNLQGPKTSKHHAKVLTTNAPTPLQDGYSSTSRDAWAEESQRELDYLEKKMKMLDYETKKTLYNCDLESF